MPLQILAILVVVGLTAIITVVHFGGGVRDIAPMTRELAMARFQLDHEAFTTDKITLSNDGHSA